MVDIDVLKKSGYSEKGLKEKLSGPSVSGSGGDKANQLKDLMSARIIEGINRSLANARYFWAVDEAFAVSQRQISPTIVRGLRTNHFGSELVNQAVSDWNLSDFLSPLTDPKTGKPVIGSGGKPLMKLDIPAFTQIFVPLVQAYLKIRWAKLWDDRNLVPLYKYEPGVQSLENRLRCDIITQSVDRFVEQVGTRSVERQSILMSLMYGTCLNYAMEPWYREKQKRRKEKEEGGKEKIENEVVKQGVRFATPHPSRCYYDLSHPLSSLNSDSGVCWAGYWDVYRWRDVASDSKFWIEDDGSMSVPASNFKSFDSSGWKMYQQLYPCSMSFPSCSHWASSLDRTKEAYRYNLEKGDMGVSLSITYAKLVPSEWDLFDYDGPVWFRFVHALEDVIIYCEPVAYCPVVAYQYDADQNNYRPTSLAYELIPWQDHVGNTLSEWLLAVKRNLANAIMYNKDGVDDSVIERLENLGSNSFTQLNFIPVSKRELTWAGTASKELFEAVKFPQTNTTELIRGIMQVINIMERVLGYSPAEVGQPASHEQSATEVATVNQNVGIRLGLTGSFIDEAITARKKRLYEAMMAYADDDVIAQVGVQNDASVQKLESLGFKVELDGENRTAGVIGNKSMLEIAAFEAGKPSPARLSDGKIAVGMLQLLSSIFTPPVLQAVGVDPLVNYLNQIMQLVGVPKELRLQVPGGSPQQQSEALLGQVAQMIAQANEAQIGQITKMLQERIVVPQAKVNEAHGARIEGIVNAINGLMGGGIPQGPQPAVPQPEGVPM